MGNPLALLPGRVTALHTADDLQQGEDDQGVEDEGPEAPLEGVGEGHHRKQEGSGVGQWLLALGEGDDREHGRTEEQSPIFQPNEGQAPQQLGGQLGQRLTPLLHGTPLGEGLEEQDPHDSQQSDRRREFGLAGQELSDLPLALAASAVLVAAKGHIGILVVEYGVVGGQGEREKCEQKLHQPAFARSCPECMWWKYIDESKRVHALVRGQDREFASQLWVGRGPTAGS